MGEKFNRISISITISFFIKKYDIAYFIMKILLRLMKTLRIKISKCRIRMDTDIVYNTTRRAIFFYFILFFCRGEVSYIS